MATGVPPKNKIKNERIQLTLAYQGKHPEQFFFDKPIIAFNKFSSLNGGGENMFFFGDNADALRYLLDTGYAGKVRLVYIDPPFATSSVFLNRNQEYAYSDFLSGGEFVEFLRERLILLRSLLANDGSIYLHLDGNMAFAMKIVMDEIFGVNNCRAFITRKKCSTKNYTKNSFGNISDYILFYSKTNAYVWNRPYDSWNYEKMIAEYPCIDEKTGRRYKKVPVHAPGVRNGETGREWRGKLPPKGKHWQYTPDRLDELDAQGEIYWSPTGNPRRKVFYEPDKGIPVQDIWLNYRDSINQAQKTTGYPTEKNSDMLRMIVSASSNSNDIVLDCFAGSGTALAAAFELDRRWIGIDNSMESYKAIYKRFTQGLDTYGDYVDHPSVKQLCFDLGTIEKCPFDIYTCKSYINLLNDKNTDVDSKDEAERLEVHPV